MVAQIQAREFSLSGEGKKLGLGLEMSKMTQSYLAPGLPGLRSGFHRRELTMLDRVPSIYG